MFSENKEERIKQVNEYKKTEFVRFALTYFNSFGWIVEKSSNNEIIALSPMREKYLIIPIVQSDESYPNFQEIEKINKDSSNVLLISEEFGQDCPLKGNKKYKLDKHTASGLQFCYLKGRNT